MGTVTADLQLAKAAQDVGDYPEAERLYAGVLARRPGHAEALHQSGLVAYRRGDHERAMGLVRQAIEASPGVPEYHVNLGVFCSSVGKLTEAVTHYRRALALNPALAEAHHNLAVDLVTLGSIDETIAHSHQALALNPKPSTHSNLLYALHFSPHVTNAELWSAHRAWGDSYGFHPDCFVPHDNVVEPQRRLRVGYVSPDLREHSVAQFLIPLFEGHDRSRVEIFCYAELRRDDGTTERLRALSDGWIGTFGQSDAAVAARIRADRIDILVDLAGHTHSNRLPVFARRPAPVQVTWLGYPNTTGMPVMDYRLTDAWADPEKTAPPCSETLVRLPHGFLCYRPTEKAPEVAASPFLQEGVVTFGSFNNIAKVSPEVIDVWGRLLAAVERSRLLLKSLCLADPGVRSRIEEGFKNRGVAQERLTLVGQTPEKADHLAAYAGVDIALDPFPYNGTTTTCEALWMGVPVITLAGDHHAARVGVSLLSRIGLPELIARDRPEYVRIAATLASDRDRLATLRTELRPRVAASPLCDHASFARGMEDAYRTMWRKWCAQRRKK